MSVRTERVAGEIKQKLAELFQTEFTELYSGLLTVTICRVSPDLHSCKVYISLLGNTKSKELIVKDIQNAAPRIRSALAGELRMRHTPELFFYLDDTQDEVERINRLFKKLNDTNSAE